MRNRTILTSNKARTYQYRIHKHGKTRLKIEKKDIFAWFVDFKTRDYFIKSFNSGVGSKVYDVIKSTYLKNEFRKQLGNERAEYFTQVCRVREYCNRYPVLFSYVHQCVNGVTWTICSHWTHLKQYRSEIFCPTQTSWSCWTRLTQSPGPAGIVLSDLAPDSQSSQNQNCNLKKKNNTQVSGKQVRVHSKNFDLGENEKKHKRNKKKTSQFKFLTLVLCLLCCIDVRFGIHSLPRTTPHNYYKIGQAPWDTLHFETCCRFLQPEGQWETKCPAQHELFI